MNKMKRKRLLVSIGIFLFLGIAFSFYMNKSGKVIYGYREEIYSSTEGYFAQETVALSSDTEIVEKFTCTDNNLTSFSIKFELQKDAEGYIYVSLFEEDSKNTIQEWRVPADEIISGESYLFQLKEKLSDPYGKDYKITVKAEAAGVNVWVTKGPALSGGNLFVNGEKQDNDLSMSLLKEKYVLATRVYSIIICFLLSVGVACIFYFQIWKYIRTWGTAFIRSLEKNRIYYLKIIIACCLSALAAFVFERYIYIDKSLDGNIADSFNRYIFTFVLISCLAGFMIFILRKYLKYKPENVFLVVMLLIGFLYIFALPAEAEISWDESIHYWRAVGLSHPTTGYANAAEGWLYWHSGIPFGMPNEIKNLDTLHEMVQGIYDTGKIIPADTDVLGKIYFIAYIPSAIALKLGRALHLPFEDIFRAGAGANMIVYISTIYFAMKRLKSGKMILAVISASVTSVFLASVYSTDTWIIGFTILGFSYFLGCMQDNRKIKNHDLIIMLFSFGVAFMPKSIYFPLFLLFLFLPPKFFTSNRQYRYFVSGCFAFMGALAGSMIFPLVFLIPIGGIIFVIADLVGIFLQRCSFKGKILFFSVSFLCVLCLGFFLLKMVMPAVVGVGDLRGGEGVNSAKQIAYILENPLEFIRMLLRFLKNHYLSFTVNWKTVFTTFGYIGSTKMEVIALVLLLIVAVTDKNKEDSWYSYRLVSLTTIFVVLSIIVLMATALYISYTPVGLNTVLGLQPRYLLPLGYPLFIMLGSGNIRNYINRRLYNGCVIGISGFVLLYSLWEIVILGYH